MIDASIPLKGGASVQLLNPMDVAQQAMTMKKIAQQNAAYDQEQAQANSMRDILKKNVVTDANGNATLNKQGAISDLYKVAPQKAMEYQQQFQKQDLEKLKNEADIKNNLAWQISDEQTYQQARQKAIEIGLPNADKMPSQYPGDSFIRQMQMSTLSAKEQLDQQWKKMDFDKDVTIKDREYQKDLSFKDMDNKYRQQDLASRAADRKEARDERRFQAGIKMEEQKQGLKTPFGLANTEDDAKKLKEAFESKSTFDGKLQQMIDLRTKHSGGALMNREDVARGKQLSKDLLLEYKNMAKLGVLSKSDEDIINAIIPEDPLQFNSPLDMINKQDPTLARLKSFQADSNKDFQTKVSTRTRSGVEGAAKQPNSNFHPEVSEAFKWAKANPNDPRAQEIMKRIGN